MEDTNVEKFVKDFNGMKQGESIRFEYNGKSLLEIPKILNLKIKSEMWFGHQWDCECEGYNIFFSHYSGLVTLTKY